MKDLGIEDRLPFYMVRFSWLSILSAVVDKANRKSERSKEGSLIVVSRESCQKARSGIHGMKKVCFDKNLKPNEVGRRKTPALQKPKGFMHGERN